MTLPDASEGSRQKQRAYATPSGFTLTQVRASLSFRSRLGRLALSRARNFSQPAISGGCFINRPRTVNLNLMRRSASPLWILALGFVLTVLLGAAYHPQVAHDPAAGMAAPLAPRISLESGAIQKLPRPQFDGSASGRLAAGIEFLTFATRIDEYAGRVICSARHYGPLHRRPPPSLS